MSSKKIGALLMGALFGFCSCVDDTYDLSKKELSLDMKIEGNKLAFPLGNLRALMLESLLSTEDEGLLKEMNGVYGFSYSGSVGPIKERIKELSFEIEPISYKEDFSFSDAKVDLDNIEMPGEHEVVPFNISLVSVDDINDYLPVLQEEVQLPLITEELKEKLPLLGATLPQLTVPFNEFFSLEQSIPVSFFYDLPKEVKLLRSIQFTDKTSSKEELGALIQLHVAYPRAFIGLEKSLEFQMDFPEMFEVSLCTETAYGKYSLEHNVLKVTELPVNVDDIVVKFYLKGFVGLDNDTYYEKVGEVNRFVFDSSIPYSLCCNVEGDLVLDASVKAEDFNLGVQLNAELELYDLLGDTNPIDFNFKDDENRCIKFSTEIKDLKYISEVKSVRLNPKESQIRLSIDMPEDYAPFELRHGHSFKIYFPEFLYFNEDLTQIPAGMTYNNETHILEILDDEALDNASLVLALDSIAINQKVENGSVCIAGEARLTTDGGVVFEGNTVSLRYDLPALRNKKIYFDLEDTRFVIEEIVVVSDTIAKDLHIKKPINICEPIDEGLGKIYSIDFQKDVEMNLAFNIMGLDEVDTPVNLNVQANIPSFICLETNDPDISYDNGVLNIEAKYIPGEKFEKYVKISKFDFTKLKDGCLSPIKEENGLCYLQYNDSVSIDASAWIGKTEISDAILDKFVEIEFDLSIAPIVVGLFEGIYNAPIGKVEESFSIDLGEELAFLKNEDNVITLSEPQITIAIENSINVPLLVDLLIIGKDEQGAPIESSRIELGELRINPANYDESTGVITADSTKILFTSNDGVKLAGYETVVVEKLATLLNTLPSSVAFELQPKIDTTVIHRVDFSQPLSFSGDYAINVPLKFNEINICYVDTISELQLDVADFGDYFSNMELHVRMNVMNTLPIGLSVSALPLDAQGNILSNVLIEDVSISAGNGGDVNMMKQSESIEIIIKNKGKVDLHALNQLALCVTASADQTVGGIALKPEQGIKISDIILEICADLEVDLNEINK